MFEQFAKYSDIIFSAYTNSSRQTELVEKKREILTEVIEYYNLKPTNILFIGFNPCISSFSNDTYFTAVSSNTRSYLIQQGSYFIEETDLKDRKFDIVVALDEFLTFANTDIEQKDLINFLSEITKKCIITTLRDYKNQDFRDKEFSNPIILRDQANKKIYLEHYDYSLYDRNSCLATNYIISDDSVDIIGPFARRNLFFKQLAKFSLDAGASSFLIHKNLMHKNIIKKNYEHLITIKFDI